MANAEGRMEVTQEQIDEAEYDVRQSMTADDRQTTAEYSAGERGLRLILSALAAARAENERMGEALTHYANAVNWMSHTDADAMLRVWIGSGDGPDYARRALTAQEGTR